MFFHSRSRSQEFLGMIASDSHSRIVGMDFFHSLPVPELWEWIFSFPSRSRIMGMVFFHSLPVSELWEWIFLIPFPFPNLLFHRRESKRELDYCKRYQASNFFSFLYISQNNYIEEVNWAKMFKSEWLKRQDILLSFVANSFAAKMLVIVNKIILFWFLFINSGRYNNKKTGRLSRMEEDGVENVWAKTLSHATFLLNIFSCHVDHSLNPCCSDILIQIENSEPVVGLKLIIIYLILWGNQPLILQQEAWSCEKYLALGRVATSDKNPGSETHLEWGCFSLCLLLDLMIMSSGNWFDFSTKKNRCMFTQIYRGPRQIW